MASSSGTCSNSSAIQSSGSSEEELQAAALMEQRKRKRMVSNRESARRSRLRKQKHLDDLMAQVGRLQAENRHIAANLGVTAQRFAAVEAENSVLRAQAAELGHRLQSLAEIVCFLNPSTGIFDSGAGGDGGNGAGGGGGCFGTLENAFYMSQPLMASAADVFEY